MKRIFGLFLLCASAQAAPITGTFTYPTQNTDGTVVPVSGAGSITSTKVEYGTCSGTAFGTKLGEVNIPAPTKSYSTPDMPAGTYCLRALVTNTYGVSSAFTAAVTRTVPPPTPNPPVLTVDPIVYLWRKNDVQRVVGVIDIGEVCGKRLKGDFYEVNRDNVTLVRPVVKGSILTAKCA